jgi:hypothetical protein
MIEFEFELPMDIPNVMFRGKVDAVLENIVTGHIEIFDWKTTSSFKAEDKIVFDQQIPLYQYAISLLTKVPVTATNYYQVMSDTPNEPKITKSGKMNLSACRTTWELWSDVAVDNFFDDPNFQDVYNLFEEYLAGDNVDMLEYYDDMLEHVERVYGEEMKPKLNFQPSANIRLYRSPQTLERFWNNAHSTVAQLVKLETDLNNDVTVDIPMVLNTFSCMRCQFNKVCSSAINGDDPQEVLASEFVQHTTYEELEQDDIEG